MIRNKHSVVLKANQDTLVTTDFDTSHLSSPVSVGIYNLANSANTFDGPNFDFKVLESTYEIEPLTVLKIIVRNNTFNDIFIDPSTPIAHAHEFSHPQHSITLASFHINVKEKT